MNQSFDYTPLELLLFFRHIAHYGSQAPAIEQASRWLAANRVITQDVTFSPERLFPAALVRLSQALRDGSGAARGSALSETTLKRKSATSAHSSSAKTARSAGDIAAVLYARYAAHQLASIRKDELDIRELRKEVIDIEQSQSSRTDGLAIEQRARPKTGPEEPIHPISSSSQPAAHNMLNAEPEKSPAQHHGRSISIADLLSHDAEPAKPASGRTEQLPPHSPAFNLPSQPPSSPQSLSQRQDHKGIVRNVPPYLSIQTTGPNPGSNQSYERMGHPNSFLPMPMQPSPQFSSHPQHQYSPSYGRVLPSPIQGTNPHPPSRSGFSPPYPLQHYALPSPYPPNGSLMQRPPYGPSPRTPATLHTSYQEHLPPIPGPSDTPMGPPPTPPQLPTQTSRGSVPASVLETVCEKPEDKSQPSAIPSDGGQKDPHTHPVMTSPIPPATEGFSPTSEQESHDTARAGTTEVASSTLPRSFPESPESGRQASAKRSSSAARNVEDEALAPVTVDQDSQLLALRSLQRTSGTLLSDICQHRFASFFAAPVRPRDAPGYADVVYRPQDFKSIRSALSSGSRALINLSSTATDDSEIEGLTAAEKANQSFSVPNVDEWRPPKVIVTPAQLETEITRVFANAVMFNSEAPQQLAFVRQKLAGRTSMITERVGSDDDSKMEIEAEEMAEERRPGYEEREGAMVEDTQQMWDSARDLLKEWKNVGQ